VAKSCFSPCSASSAQECASFRGPPAQTTLLGQKNILKRQYTPQDVSHAGFRTLVGNKVAQVCVSVGVAACLCNSRVFCISLFGFRVAAVGFRGFRTCAGLHATRGKQAQCSCNMVSDHAIHWYLKAYPNRTMIGASAIKVPLGPQS